MAQPAQLDLTVDAGPITVITLVGELDAAMAPLLEQAVELVIDDAGVTRLVLDLAGLTFLDSAGLRIFVTAREVLGRRDGELALRRPTDNARRLLDITGLGEVIEVE